MSDTLTNLALGDFLEVSRSWPEPTVIVCDGPYGLGIYDGEPANPSRLSAWYEPHVARFTEAAGSHTTLWFWNSEIGWANVHHLLERYGWVYHSANIWNKGIAHIAGNSNTGTLRRFPVVSELCIQYVRPAVVSRSDADGSVTLQEWLRSEWRRTGLPFSEANRACGVKNAATRKYLTTCDKWYMPPPPVYDALVSYANEHGDPDGRPYFRGEDGYEMPQYHQLRSKFACPAGVTNVWDEPAVRGAERVKVAGRAVHPNQKPLALMERIILASSEPGDVVWEPFGGVCSAAVAAAALRRVCYSAEIAPEYHAAAEKRLSVRQLRFEQMMLF